MHDSPASINRLVSLPMLMIGFMVLIVPRDHEARLPEQFRAGCSTRLLSRTSNTALCVTNSWLHSIVARRAHSTVKLVTWIVFVALGAFFEALRSLAATRMARLAILGAAHTVAAVEAA